MNLPPSERSAFTLIELMVVMLVMGVLMGMLIPAVNSARNAARATQSKNNLRQVGLAMNVFQSSKGYFPPSGLFPESPASGVHASPWSIHTLLLPYLEQKAIFADLDYSLPYNHYVDDDVLGPGVAAPRFVLADGTQSKLGALRVPTFVSPAEPRDETRQEKHYPVNYAINLGTWFVYDPATGEGGGGAAYPNSRLCESSFFDGMSNTLAFAEVRAWQPYYRQSAQTAGALAAIPNSPAELAAHIGAAQFQKESGHTEWLDGRAHQIGFTTVFPPNHKVLCANADGTVNLMGAGTVDVDWTNWREGAELYASPPNETPTYAAITARSYFSGVVNVSMVDGSVRTISDSIHIGVWRALSTRNGQELLPNQVFMN